MKSLNRILRAVSRASGIPIEEITSDSRKSHLVAARTVYYQIARTQQTTCSLERIALGAGKKDHTTVIHGLKKHDAFYGLYDDYTDLYDKSEEAWKRTR